MEVYIHSDSYLASIAISLEGCQVENNPIGDLTQKQFADELKKENIRSYNYAHGKRQKITTCYMGEAMEFSIPELLLATREYERQSSAREDYSKLGISTIIAAMYSYLPEVLDEYENLSVSGVTIADVLKTFALYDDGTGLKAWHWDEDWGLFEQSDKVALGRVKPYPWLLRQLGGEPGPMLSFERAEVTDPLKLVKFMKECITLPSGETPRKIYNYLLREHATHIR